ncbi:hypothetical protein DICPUDRAFT_152496 [Dictyostelium purpureum]|uniref:Aldehyde dehydrogenase domain-containing protein n=1 Tax=Dictyostelium purpureum TaxID=5786 RepID=F0ZLI4_DICPU|nr:uncharacterized protein DICPUDRAFT_152496 [Dictyostelium purpureum]EGC35195.1 hypothetical protein DICPUDRAFT_152496 [Dictyostelium purpureum]|eukprot:XP_003288283.1 hypothetical protein DICPUDRAFT_152496 [Dictyostelium purpureum]
MSSNIKLPNTKLFINNEFVEPIHKKTIPVINPTTGKEICQVSEGDASDVDKAVKCAQDALEGEWGQMSAEDRGKLMYKLADLLEAEMERFVNLESLDNGKPLSGAREDLTVSIRCLRYFAGWCDKIQGKTIPINGQYTCFTKHEPMGVVALIVAWNYPLMLLCWKLGPALAAGCTIVAKPSEFTPLTSLLFCELVQKVLPKGVFNLVVGSGEVVGKALAEHMDIAKISFTGSTAVGKKIQQAAASNLKKVTLELGGKSPNIIFDDADIEYSANCSINAIFANMGQNCCAGSRLFVQENIYDAFVSFFTQKAKTLSVGNPFEDPNLGPLVSQIQLDRVLSFIEKGKSEGATCHLGGKRKGEEGYFVEPTIFTNVTDEMTIAKEEIFGPVISILKFKTVDEVIKRANNTKYGLAAGVFTKDISLAFNVTNKLKAGSVWINEYDLINPQIPFGGYKSSGFGKDLGSDSIDAYINIKAVVVSHKTMFAQQKQ